MADIMDTVDNLDMVWAIPGEACKITISPGNLGNLELILIKIMFMRVQLYHMK